MKHWTIRRTLLTAVAFAGGLGVGVFAMSLPAIPAAMCPGCFGLMRTDAALADVYEERDRPADVRPFDDTLRLSWDRVEAAFGPVSATPRILVCHSQACFDRLGGGQTRAMAYGDRLVTFGPRGVSRTIVTHELSHIALHARLGLAAQAAFPAWLDEGIATYVSRDPRFDLNPATCAVASDPLPQSAREWRRAAGREATALYAAAGCAVAKWLEANPDATVMDLVAAYR